MNETNRFRRDCDVFFQKLGEETVIAHMGTGRVHYANSTGSRIWEMIESGRCLREIRQTLLEEFLAEPNRLQRELDGFIEQLTAEGMIHTIAP